MSITEIANKIPEKYRRMILEGNLIYKAVPNKQDVQMQQLFVIWRNYINPGGDETLDCNMCLNNMMRTWKELQPVLLQIEKENKLLDL